MENKTLSYIVINHNNAAYLKKCIFSLIRQDYPYKEIVLVDDGSSDDSVEIAETMAKACPFLHVYKNENHGISYSRNFGIKMAQGEYFTFIDSDDFIDEKMGSTMMSYMKDDVDLVVCGFVIDYPHFPLYRAAPKKECLNQKEALHALLKNTGINNYPWNKIFKKALFEGIEFPLDKPGFEDIATIYKYVMRCRKVYSLPNRFYHYVQHSGSYTNHMKLKDTVDMWNAFDEQEAALRKAYPDDNFSAYTNKYRTHMCMYYSLWRYESKWPEDFRIPEYDDAEVWPIFKFGENVLSKIVHHKFNKENKQ